MLTFFAVEYLLDLFLFAPHGTQGLVFPLTPFSLSPMIVTFPNLCILAGYFSSTKFSVSLSFYANTKKTNTTANTILSLWRMANANGTFNGGSIPLFTYIHSWRLWCSFCCLLEIDRLLRPGGGGFLGQGRGEYNVFKQARLRGNF